MKIASIIARLLFGALFLFAGSNHIFNFMPQQPSPPGPVGQMVGGMITTGFMVVVGICEALPAILLLINRFVPLALLVLAPIIFNIIVINAMMSLNSLLFGAALIVLWCLTAWRPRTVFFPLLSQKVAD
jgi:uncharacterized membrane protein YphA (DoxX/SURF4 family)